MKYAKKKKKSDCTKESFGEEWEKSVNMGLLCNLNFFLRKWRLGREENNFGQLTWKLGWREMGNDF